MKPGKRPVLIAGGGIGGLSSAIALARKGFEVRVLERATEYGAIGYGIQLGPNVFPMFDRMGVTDAILAVSIEPEAVLMYDAYSGDEVIRVPTGKASFKERFKRPYIVLHRIDLHNVLLHACRALPNVVCEDSVAVAGYENAGDHVVLAAEDGRTFEGEIAIAADGVGSVLRAQMLAGTAPRFNGYAAHRTIVPIAQAPAGVPTDVVVLWAGDKFHIVHYPLRDHTEFNVVAVFRTDTFADRMSREDNRAELDRVYAETDPRAQAMIAMLGDEWRGPVADLDPIRQWSDGRVLLLGDAAHATLQTYAQGACMAIEDAVVLAETLAAPGVSHEDAFEAFRRLRLVRTARVQLESRTVWEMYHCAGIAAEVRRATYRDQTDEQVFDCLGWIYDGPELPD